MADCEVTRETRDVSGFTRVDLAGTGTLKVALGDEERLTIEADPKMLERVTSDVRDGELRLGIKKGSWLRSLKCEGIVYELTMKDVSALSLSGAGTIEAGALTARRLKLSVSGAGLVRIVDLRAEELIVILSGECKCELEGRADSQDVKLTGTGTYNARALESATAKLTLSGSGDMLVNVSDTIDVTISGAGNVTCYGEATVFRRVTGAGSIMCVCEDGEEPHAAGTEGGEP